MSSEVSPADSGPDQAKSSGPNPSGQLAVSIQGVSKTYSIQTAKERPTLFSEAVTGWLRRPFRRSPRHDFAALDDITADIRVGEAVGIIGRNGAGKSTLLKVLSRVTSPSAGRVELYGRVGSLLEVGTGFHPELTGRENVYLNGAILGMRRSEIARAFDSIVEFAQISEFLDTPVKRYSSGMYVRLAFAVAAHLEPEILVVDEVLAVGDAEFQRRCLGKMNEVSTREGRTVLFVSHNMTAVSSFCRRVIHLERGRVAYDGDAAEGIRRYIREVGDVEESASGVFDLSDRPRQSVTAHPVLRKVEVRRLDGSPTNRIPMGDGFTLTIHVEGLRVPRHFVAVGMVSDADVSVAQVNTVIRPLEMIDAAAPQNLVVLKVPRLSLNPGRYWFDLRVSEGGGGVAKKTTVDRMERAAYIDVEAWDIYGSGFEPPKDPSYAVCFVDHTWEIQGNGLVLGASHVPAAPLPVGRAGR